MSVEFILNGKLFQVFLKDHPVDITLITFIRDHAQLFGTKFMCLEGGCGVCICLIKRRHPHTKEVQTFAINSCLVLLNTCDNCEIITIEGIGNRKIGYNPIQTRLAHHNGSQCGYCSPGMVMNMLGLLESKLHTVTMQEVEDSFDGNICRCTGYRAILDAMKSFASDNEYELIDMCQDIEDMCLKPCPPKTNLKLEKCSQVFKCKYVNGKEWLTARTIKELFQILFSIGEKEYTLIAGATADGVYRRSPSIKVYIDINAIGELHSFECEGNLVLGANMSINETISLFKTMSTEAGFEYLLDIAKHYEEVATTSVRNIGTLAGNLIIKHTHNDFPSDVFTTLVGANACLSIMSDEHTEIEYSLTEFLDLKMQKKIITRITLPRLSTDHYFYASYKIAKRAQNAHAYVNSGFLLKQTKGEIEGVNICFGGIAPNFVHSTETEKFLIGKNIFDNATVKEALKILNGELNLTWKLPEASPEYRRLLACGFFYKFILKISPMEIIEPAYYSGGKELHRGISSGTHEFITKPDKYPLTEPIPKVESLIQCAGEAIYSNDIPNKPGQVWLAFVVATKVNAKIEKIDDTEARKIPGVVDIFFATDIPGINSFVNTNDLGFEENEEIFCSSLVKYYDQPIGVVAAETLEIAKFASKKIEVIYGEDQSKSFRSFIDIVESASQKFRKNIESFETIQSDIVQKVSGTLNLAGQYHFTMEPQTTICLPDEQGMKVLSSAQFMDMTQSTIALSLKIPENSICVQVRRVGGAYGCKISRGIQIACSCALVCHKLNRPARFVQSLRSMMKSLGKRMANHCEYNVNFRKSGKILTLKNQFYTDVGCTINESPIQIFTLPIIPNCYKETEMWDVIGKNVVTDAPSNTWCRGPGNLEGVAMTENIMEHIAFALKVDASEVRLQNISSKNRMKDLYPKFLNDIQYKDRKAQIEVFNNQNRWHKKGIATSLMQYPIEVYGQFPCTVSVYNGDGTVSISHGGIEMGQGMNTRAIQVAAYTFGISKDMIKVLPSNSFVGANAMISGASMSSQSIGYATRNACEIILERIKPVREASPSKKWVDIIQESHKRNILLTATSSCKMGDIPKYYVYGLCCSEIEVDVLTGQVIINRVDIFEDTGESISPVIDLGQIEGAFIMGVGYWLTEELIYNRQTGELLTDRTWNYKPPGAKDIPIDFRIKLLQKNPNNAGFLKSKSTGEPAICLSVSVMFALRNALISARKNAGLKDEWIELTAPTTRESALLLSGSHPYQYSLH